eukprot:7666664-Lingulodinium_polyedra.AAC.1
MMRTHASSAILRIITQFYKIANTECTDERRLPLAATSGRRHYMLVNTHRIQTRARHNAQPPELRKQYARNKQHPSLLRALGATNCTTAEAHTQRRKQHW